MDVSLFRQAWLPLSLGIALVVVPLVAYWLGRWLAKATGQTAWEIIGIGLGLASMVVIIFRLLRWLTRNGT